MPRNWRNHPRGPGRQARRAAFWNKQKETSLAGIGPRQQCRPGSQGAEKEDATGRRLPRDEAPKVLRKAIGENGTRKKRSIRRARKLARKQAQREGLIAAPRKKEPGAGKTVGRRQLPTHR